VKGGIVVVSILLTKSSLTDINSQLKRMQSETEEARKKVNSAIRGLDFEVASKQNIKTKMNKLNSTLSQQISLLDQYRSTFANVYNSLKETDEKFGNESRTLLDGIKDYIDDSVSSIKDFLISTKLTKVAAVSGMFLHGESTAKKTKTSFLSKLVNFGEKIVDDITDKTKEIYGNVVQAGKDCASWAKEKVDDAVEWYNENEEQIKAYGKTALKIGAASVKLVGAAVSIGTGAGIPLGILSAVTAINDISNAHADLVYIKAEQYENVGTTNVLKDYLKDSGKQIGSYFGNEQIGETFGEALYTGINVVTFLDGADKMLTSLGKANTVLTGTYGSSSGWAWDWQKTSFEAIESSKIKFSLEADYFIRKLMKVDPSSTGNIIYEAGKNIVKMFGKASSLGEEFGSYIN